VAIAQGVLARWRRRRLSAPVPEPAAAPPLPGRA
jgi:hypothetical protein